MSIDKTVKLESVKLSDDEFSTIDRMYYKGLLCKNDFYQRFAGVKSLSLIQNSKDLRQILRPLHLEQTYDFPQRFWIMILFDVCSNLKSCWSNLSNNLKTIIRENDNLTDNDKAYLYYVLSAPKIWSQILNRQDIITTKKLDSLAKGLNLKYLHNYLRRITRKYKFKTPKAKSLRCISLDQEMYSIIDDIENNKSAISFITDKPNSRLVIKLKSKYCYSKKGNIQLIFNRDKRCIEIHKLISIKNKVNNNDSKSKINLGIDKGYATLLSCSNDKEYGINLGELFTKEANRLNKRNTNRNYFIQKGVKIGNKTYDKQRKKAKENITKEINYAIKQMIKENNPKLIVKEELPPKKNTHKGKFFNHIISNWLSGVLDERLKYICSVYSIETKDINPAYTSQYCNKCNAHLIERKGKHHEIGICPNCGEINANTNASKNILDRLDDIEITLYTPYKKVKDILDSRITK